MLALAAAALIVWIGVLTLPPRGYLTRERLRARSAQTDLSMVAVLIPARNEAPLIARSLAALGRQGHGLEVIVVDDHSEDGTAAVARAAAAPWVTERAGSPAPWSRFELLSAAPLAPGWSGKLWALEQGLAAARRPYTLLLDADIELAPGVVGALLERSRSTGAALVSVMARLRCESGWERMLVPPFVFFFKLLYPFGAVNDPRSSVAAAAGGCILVETAALRAVGGFGAIRSELIDDCALAHQIKHGGRALWLGLSDDVRSLRPYPRFRDFWDMVTRTAFTELRYSSTRLALATVLLLIAFAAPPATLVLASADPARWMALAALLAMAAAYFPVARFYGRPLGATLTLPLAALAYLAMTWGSALAYWRGVRARWKNRAYEPS